MTVTNDFGNTWTSSLLQSDDIDGIFGQNQGMIVVQGANMYATWNADDGGSNVYFSKNINGVAWDASILLSPSPIGNFPPQLILNDDASKILVSWINGSGQILQSVSTNGGMSFSPAVLDNGGKCDSEYDIDNLGDDIIFMCDGSIPNTGRLVKLSNNFGINYDTSFSTLNGTSFLDFSTPFPNNVGTINNFFSIWQNPGPATNPTFLSFSQDKGQNFNYEMLNGMDGVELESGGFSRQAVFDDLWYWFIQRDSTTIDFVKVILPNGETKTDHYLGYEVNDEHDNQDTKEKHDDSSNHEKLQVTLEDVFEGKVNYNIEKPKKLFNPVDKNEEGIVNPESHLVGYKLKKIKDSPEFNGIKNILVTNQFGDITVDIKKAKMLLVPSSKNLTSIPPVLEDTMINHFKCYNAKPKYENLVPIQVSLTDQFGSLNMDVKKPKMLCSPVDKNGEGIVNDENFVMCYDLKKIKGEPKFKKISVFTNNQFGTEELEVEKPNQLCVPSTIVDIGQPQLNVVEDDVEDDKKDDK